MNTVKRLALCVAVALLVSSDALAPEVLADCEKYSVYSTALGVVRQAEGTDFLIGEWTKAAWSTLPDTIFAQLDRATLNDFDRANTLEHRIRPSFRLKYRLARVARETLETARALISPQPAFRVYPPLVTLSGVGFNTERTQALVYAEYWSSHGESFAILLTKKSGNWVVKNQETFGEWIS